MRNQSRDLRTCGQKDRRKTKSVYILEAKRRKVDKKRKNDRLSQTLLIRQARAFAITTQKSLVTLIRSSYSELRGEKPDWCGLASERGKRSRKQRI